MLIWELLLMTQFWYEMYISEICEHCDIITICMLMWHFVKCVCSWFFTVFVICSNHFLTTNLFHCKQHLSIIHFIWQKGNTFQHHLLYISTYVQLKESYQLLLRQRKWRNYHKCLVSWANQPIAYRWSYRLYMEQQ